jgi:hypothetical protein
VRREAAIRFGCPCPWDILVNALKCEAGIRHVPYASTRESDTAGKARE